MDLIAVADIFGNTKAFEKLINEIAHHFDKVDIVAPYDKRDINFQNEFEAYTYFQKHVGLEKYIEMLNSKVQGSESGEQLLLGFSVGATAIWAMSENPRLINKTKGVCFYSSQIRNYLEVNPKIEIDLYFSRYEPSYDVNKISNEVSGKPNVQCYTTTYLHGFMNEKSKNFDQEGCFKFINRINKSVTNGSTRTR